MNAKSLISAKLEGVGFDRIPHAVRTDREVVSALPEDQLEFLESMLSEVKSGVLELDKAIKSDDLAAIRETSQSLREIFQMLEDSCDE